MWCWSHYYTALSEYETIIRKRKRERNYSHWWVWASNVTANISRATSLCQFLGTEDAPETFDRTEEGKQDAGPKSQETGQGEMQAKIERQTKLHARTGWKETDCKIRCGEDFLEESFELHVKIQVWFWKMWGWHCEMEERQRYSLQKGFEWRTMRGIIWRMTFEDLSSSHDPHLVYSMITWSLVDNLLIFRF